MELRVKRSEIQRFEKGRLEFTSDMEWAVLTCALKESLESSRRTLNLFEKQQSEQKTDFSATIRSFQESISILENMINSLDSKNELSWK